LASESDISTILEETPIDFIPLDSAVFIISFLKFAQRNLIIAPRTRIDGGATRRDFLLDLDFLDFLEPLLERLLDLRDDLREALLILRLERLLDLRDDLRDNFLLDLDLRLLPPS
jgi:hypothetical protein